jgi:predicted amidophosphoribosyltransferase
MCSYPWARVPGWIADLTASGWLWPPLPSPTACAKCQRPRSVGARGFSTCFPCGHSHVLEWVRCATYKAGGTRASELLTDVKYPNEYVRQSELKLAAVAMGLWLTVEGHVPLALGPDPAIVAVPLPSSHRLIDRCAALASENSWPELRMTAAITAEDRPPQTGASQADREANAAGKYSCDARVEGQDVVLLDDVYTTGASARDAARAARVAGASSVRMVAYARAINAEGAEIYRQERP